MTEREMFERAFQRPRNFRQLSYAAQWEIDKELGILDWQADDLSREDIARFNAYFSTE